MMLTDVYIREMIPYAYFFPEDGKEDTEIYVVFGLKRMISCSVPTVIGKTVSPLPPCLKEFVQFSEICLEGSGTDLLVV